MPTIRILLVLVPAFFIASALLPDAAAFAQGAQNDETDQQFLSRMLSRLSRSERRAEELEKLARQKMGMGSSSGSGMGVGVDIGTSGSYDRTTSRPMNSDVQSIRLELRSLRKKIGKDTERMGDEFRSRDNEEFDRDYWEGYVRRLERDLDEMDRDLRRL